MKKGNILLLILIFVFLTGCQTLQIEENKSLRYHGHYSVDFEAYEFKPCGHSKSWWVSYLPGELSMLEPGKNEYWEVLGIVSETGHFGHLGLYEREIKIQKVLLRDIPRKDCDPPIQRNTEQVSGGNG